MNQSNGDDLKTPKEISLGIIGNLACYEALLKHIVSTNGLIEIVVDQLFLEDSQCLCEACWLLTLGIQSSECITWAKALQSEHVIYHILWIVENTLNLQLIEKVVFDAPNGVISTMKPGANWVVMHLLKWMYVLYGVRKILEGWGVLYVDVYEERMHHFFFLTILAFVMGLAFLLGSGTSSYICYLRIIDGAQWFSIFFLLISHFENLEPFEYLKIRLVLWFLYENGV